MSRQATAGLFGYRSGMTDGTPPPPAPPPEAVLLRLVRKAQGVSLQQAARAAGISKAWLSSIETGHDSRARYGDGTRTVRASDEIIARLALLLQVSPERLETDGQRPDASAVLREMLRQRRPAPVSPSQHLSVLYDGAGDGHRMDGYTLDAAGDRHYLSAPLQRIWTDPDLASDEELRLALIRRAEEMRRERDRGRNGGAGERSA